MGLFIQKYIMVHMKSGKKHKRRNRTATLRNNQNGWEKGRLLVVRNTGSGYH